MLEALKSKEYLIHNRYPSLIKYMGSKSKIMDFILEGINKVHDGGAICDLFSGSASLAGAIGQQCPVHSNDIQSYSKILADTYNTVFFDTDAPSSSKIIEQAESIVNQNRIDLGLQYSKQMSLSEYNKIEDKQKKLLNKTFDYKWHLFCKNYSGTWWSYEQCLWIDAIRQVAEKYRDQAFYPAILSSLMFGMAYASQGTGHYAQYRDAKTQTSLRDILIYRRRSIKDYFIRKFEEVSKYAPKSAGSRQHASTSLDYRDCLKSFEGGTVYADPPYCFVHYSRFYHALETLVLYDFPDLQVQRGSVVKGRYREVRHQSPFCIKSQVPKAFEELFEGVKKSNSNLVLSYSNTGMITIDEVREIGQSILPSKQFELLTTDHQHMTLGRKEDRIRDVKECLFLIH